MKRGVFFALGVCLALAGVAAGELEAGHDEPKSVVVVCSTDSATVSWDAVGDSHLQGYDVYQSQGGAYVKVTPSPVTTTWYTATNLSPTTTYSFGVVAVYSDGHASVMSSPATCTTG